MSTDSNEPPRLSRGGDADLRRLIDDARADVPSTDRLDAIFARLPKGPPGGGSGGDGGDGPRPTKPIATASTGISRAFLGAAFGVTSAVVLGGSIYMATRPPPAPVASTTTTTRTPTDVASAPSAAALVATASNVAADTSAAPSARAPAPSAVAVGPGTGAATSASAAPSASGRPARSEADLLREAQSDAASNPSAALALCDQHERDYPNGVLAEEREFIRIQALMSAGRVGEARSRADAFEARHPGSAHTPRLEEIVGRAKPTAP